MIMKVKSPGLISNGVASRLHSGSFYLDELRDDLVFVGRDQRRDGETELSGFDPTRRASVVVDCYVVARERRILPGYIVGAAEAFFVWGFAGFGDDRRLLCLFSRELY